MTNAEKMISKENQSEIMVATTNYNNKKDIHEKGWYQIDQILTCLSTYYFGIFLFSILKILFTSEGNHAKDVVRCLANCHLPNRNVLSNFLPC